MKISAIAKIYARQCEQEGKNFNDVPKSKKEEVQYLIENDGYQINDDGTVTKVINDETTEEE